MATKKKPAPKVTAPDPAAEESAPTPRGAWTKSQTPPEAAEPTYQLVSLEKPRRVVHESVPAHVVRFETNDEGAKVLVFDGVRCSRGVVNFHGTPCFVDGGPAPEESGDEESAA